MNSPHPGEESYAQTASGSTLDAMELPDLIEVQLRSYKWFYEEGMKELFAEISPIRDFIGRDLELYFEDYYLDDPKFDEKTSRAKNVTYEAPLRVKTRLVNKRNNTVKEQEIYLGDLPIMTPRGTFMINGVERRRGSARALGRCVFYRRCVPWPPLLRSEDYSKPWCVARI